QAGGPTAAWVTVAPGGGLPATGWPVGSGIAGAVPPVHPTSIPSRAASRTGRRTRRTPPKRTTPKRTSPLFRVGDPDVGERDEEEGHDQDPGRPVDLPFQATSRPVAAAEPAIAAADAAAEAGRLRRLDEDAPHQQGRNDQLHDHERSFDLVHDR